MPTGITPAKWVIKIDAHRCGFTVDLIIFTRLYCFHDLCRQRNNKLWIYFKTPHVTLNPKEPLKWCWTIDITNTTWPTKNHYLLNQLLFHVLIGHTARCAWPCFRPSATAGVANVSFNINCFAGLSVTLALFSYLVGRWDHAGRGTVLSAVSSACLSGKAYRAMCTGSNSTTLDACGSESAVFPSA